MPVIVDAMSDPGAAYDNQPPLSWIHTPVGVPSGVAVGFSGYAGAVGSFDLAATYGGVAMLRAASLFDNIVTGQTIALFGLAFPPSGPQMVVVGASNGDPTYSAAYAISVTGSDLLTVFSNTASDTGSGTAVSVTCATASDEVLVDIIIGTGAGAATAGADQTEQMQYGVITGLYPSAGSRQLGADGGVMSWTIPNGTWRQCAASFKAASAAGLIVPPFMINQSVNRAGTY